MLKLCSDPRVYPFREVDLSGANSDVAAVPVISGLGNRNLSFDRPDGGRNLVFRARRPRIDLSLILVDRAAALALYELAGLSRQNRERTPVLVAPNLGSSTLLSAPLSRSTRFFRRDTLTGKFELADPVIAFFAGSRFQVDDDGFLSEIPGGDPRFEPNGIARGLRLEWNFPNLFSPSHPSSGNPLWTAGAGSPEIAFDPNVESIVRGRSGATRITSTVTSTASQWYPVNALTGTAQVGRLHVGQWMRGEAVVAVGLKESGGSYDWAPGVTLSPDRWVYVWHSIPTTGATNAFSILNSVAGFGAHFEVLQGSTYAFQANANDLSFRNAQSWNELSGASPEIVELGPIRFPRDFTLAVSGTIPTESRLTRAHVLALTGGSGGNSGLYFSGHNLRFRIEDSTVAEVALTQSEHLAHAGAPYTVTLRLDSLAKTLSLDLAIRSADRSLFKRSAVYTLTDTFGPNLEDVAGLLLGGLTDSNEARPGDSLIGPVRLDARPWSDDEVDLFLDFSLSDHWSNLRLATEGNLFEIVSLSVEQIPGRWKDAKVEISLEAIDAIDDGSLSFAV